MKREICTKNACTGCAACKDCCPKRCITMSEDELGAVYPQIDDSKCVSCGLCKHVCPSLHPVCLHECRRVFAAWNTNKDDRLYAASGGIATAIYRFALERDIFVAGVRWSRDKGCCFFPINDEHDIELCRNSKYVYAEANGIYQQVKHALLTGREAIFIGLPCHVAALRSYLRKDYDALTCIDIICHGVCPSVYLEQHVKAIEEKRKRSATRLFFRNPAYYTYTYTFTLEDNGGIFYKRKVLDTDNYQLGYHRALTYRENCYQCRYAQARRTGDLTIGDFSGLGKLAPVSYERHNVSCVLQNTEKGAILLEKLKDYITMDERPKEEALSYERQLSAPSVPHLARPLFTSIYQQTHNFTIAADAALRREKLKAVKEKWSRCLKSAVKSVLPIQAIRQLKPFKK